jgi:hypothetical protein
MLWGFPFSVWELVVKIALWTAVGAGVVTAVAAFIAGYVGYELTDAVQKVGDEKVAEARAGAATAQAEAARANEAAAKVNERAASLERDAAIARQKIAEANARVAEANLQLEKIRQPRVLSTSKAQQIAQTVRRWPGIRFDVAALPGDPEALTLVGQLADCLRTGGWEWIEFNHPSGPFMQVYSWPNLPNVGQLGGEAIAVLAHADRLAEFAAAGAALAGALNAVGLIASFGSTDIEGIPNHDTLHIAVGKKPL